MMLVTLSTLSVNGYNKDSRKRLCYYNRVLKLSFTKLQDMLTKDYIYSPFIYRNGKREEINIISEAEFVVIDIDNTEIDIFERHLDLESENLNHIIATTSTTENTYKYRVLLPLDQTVDVQEYRNLVNGIIVNGLIVDMDIASKKPSQPFYAYKDSIVYSYFDGENLSVEDYSVEEIVQDIDNSNVTSDDYSILVNRYKNPGKGNGKNALVSASFTMIEAGFSKQQLEECINQINKAWISPMDEHSLYSLIIRPMQRRIK